MVNLPNPANGSKSRKTLAAKARAWTVIGHWAGDDAMALAILRGRHRVDTDVADLDLFPDGCWSTQVIAVDKQAALDAALVQVTQDYTEASMSSATGRAHSLWDLDEEDYTLSHRYAGLGSTSRWGPAPATVDLTRIDLPTATAAP